MRTFTFSDDRSHKFWNIELQGNGFTVTYGRIGAAGQTKTKTFRDGAAALKEHDELVSEKLKKGYVETTPSAKPVATNLRESLELALVENPDDLASHMAFADYLAEQGDPLGDFVRVQLALEDEKRPPAERKKLQKQEEQLLKKHGREWLGDLAPYTIDLKKSERYNDLTCKFTFARGWLDTLEISNYGVALTRVMARSPQLRLLRVLRMDNNNWEEAGDYPAGDDIPEGEEFAQLFPLVRCPYLGNVKVLTVGETMTPEEDDDAEDGGFSCHTQGDGVVGLIKRMPKLEELHLLCHNVDAEQLYSLRTLDNLRVLTHYHGMSYPLARLAKNPSLGRLTHLLCHPHALEDDPFIRLPAVRAVARSPELKSLTHLQLRLSDMGDKGVEEIIHSGLIGRLKVLDLRHGRITDAGARALAACPDAAKLDRLELNNNCLTEGGVGALRAAGVNVRAESQWRVSGDEYGDNEYLYAGDIE